MSRREPDLSTAHSWALSLANRGHDETFIARTVIQDSTIVEILEKNGKPKAEKTATRVARNAIAYSIENPVEEWRSQVPAKVAAHREQADARPWAGRTGSTDRRALETHYLTATFARSSAFNLAARLGGERGGMHELGWSRACRRLKEAGWIERTHGATEGRRAAAYRLRAVRTDTREPGGARSSVSVRADAPTLSVSVRAVPLRHPDDPLAVELLRHGAFRPAALGDAGWQVVRWLDTHEGITEPELAAATGIARRRLHVLLVRLEVSGIARRVPDGWVLAFYDDELVGLLDLFALDHGTAGALDRDRERHAAERADYDEKHGITRLEVERKDEGDDMAQVFAIGRARARSTAVGVVIPAHVEPVADGVLAATNEEAVT